MVIGSGLIGTAFRNYNHDSRVLIFASGVSNSGNTNESDFMREINLIRSYSSFSGVFVYFSTCSIYDPILAHSHYIKHKLYVEELIKSTFASYLIVRLPNVIGRTANPNTFANFFIEKIRKGETIKVQANATRYFISIDDVLECVTGVLQRPMELAHCCDLVIYEKVGIPQAIKVFESILGVKAKMELLDKGSSYDVFVDKLFNLENFNINLEPIEAFRQMLIGTYLK
jgi:nucleoside-diphosphate-sugar epimerase